MAVVMTMVGVNTLIQLVVYTMAHRAQCTCNGDSGLMLMNTVLRRAA